MILAYQLASTIARRIARWDASAIVPHGNVWRLHWKDGNLTSTITSNQANIMNFCAVTEWGTHASRLTIWTLLYYMQVCEVGTLVGIFCDFIRPQSCNHWGGHAGLHWMPRDGKFWAYKFVNFSNVKPNPGNQNNCDWNLDAWFTGNRCGEWMTELLAVGLPSNHRQMISQVQYVAKTFRWETFATATTCIAYRKCLDVVGTNMKANMKANKRGDDTGIVVELVQFVSRIFFRISNTSTMLCSTPALFQALGTKRCSSCWQKKIRSAKLPSNFRPMA